jgi:hypothetical protein
VQRSAARRRIAAAIESMAARDLQADGHIPGSRFRNVRASVLLSGLVTRRLGLPAWVTAYRYRGSVYRTIVHGQDDRLVTGEAPVSWTKILLLAAALLLLAAVLAAVFTAR